MFVGTKSTYKIYMEDYSDQFIYKVVKIIMNLLDNPKFLKIFQFSIFYDIYGDIIKKYKKTFFLKTNKLPP